MSIVLGRSMLDPFTSIWNEMDQMLQVLDQQTPHRAFAEDAKAIANTKVDWVERPEAHVINVELPGVNKEDIKVQLEDNSMLTITGERKKEEVKKEDKWHMVERSYGKFLRRFRLPHNVKVDEIRAKVDNGVLSVEIPKAQSESKPKSIDVAPEQHGASSGTQAHATQETHVPVKTDRSAEEHPAGTKMETDKSAEEHPAGTKMETDKSAEEHPAGTKMETDRSPQEHSAGTKMEHATA